MPNGGAEVCLLDHGLYTELDEGYIELIYTFTYVLHVSHYRCRKSLCGVWKSIIKHDVQNLKEESEKLGVQGVHCVPSFMCILLKSEYHFWGGGKLD